MRRGEKKRELDGKGALLVERNHCSSIRTDKRAKTGGQV